MSGPPSVIQWSSSGQECVSPFAVWDEHTAPARREPLGEEQLEERLRGLGESFVVPQDDFRVPRRAYQVRRSQRRRIVSVLRRGRGRFCPATQEFFLWGIFPIVLGEYLERRSFCYICH